MKRGTLIFMVSSLFFFGCAAIQRYYQRIAELKSVAVISILATPTIEAIDGGKKLGATKLVSGIGALKRGEGIAGAINAVDDHYSGKSLAKTPDILLNQIRSAGIFKVVPQDFVLSNAEYQAIHPNDRLTRTLSTPSNWQAIALEDIPAIKKIAAALKVDAVMIFKVNFKWKMSTGIGNTGTAEALVEISGSLVDTSGQKIWENHVQKQSGATIPILMGAYRYEAMDSLLVEALERVGTSLYDNLAHSLAKAGYAPFPQAVTPLPDAAKVADSFLIHDTLSILPDTSNSVDTLVFADTVETPVVSTAPPTAVSPPQLTQEDTTDTRSGKYRESVFFHPTSLVLADVFDGLSVPISLWVTFEKPLPRKNALMVRAGYRFGSTYLKTSDADGDVYLTEGGPNLQLGFRNYASKGWTGFFLQSMLEFETTDLYYEERSNSKFVDDARTSAFSAGVYEYAGIKGKMRGFTTFLNVGVGYRYIFPADEKVVLDNNPKERDVFLEKSGINWDVNLAFGIPNINEVFKKKLPGKNPN